MSTRPGADYSAALAISPSMRRMGAWGSVGKDHRLHHCPSKPVVVTAPSNDLPELAQIIWISDHGSPTGVQKIPQTRVRQNRDFMKYFNVIWVVQSLAKKYFAFVFSEIGDSLPLSRAHKRGVSRSSRTLGAGCDGRFGGAGRARPSRTAKSCGPDTPTLVSSLRMMNRERRWQESPVTGESTK
jgi:hypothetical protein